MVSRLAPSACQWSADWHPWAIGTHWHLLAPSCFGLVATQHSGDKPRRSEENTTKIMEKTVLQKPFLEKISFEKPILEEDSFEQPILEKDSFEKPILEKVVLEKPFWEKNRFWKIDVGKIIDFGKSILEKNRFWKVDFGKKNDFGKSMLEKNRFWKNRLTVPWVGGCCPPPSPQLFFLSIYFVCMAPWGGGLLPPTPPATILLIHIYGLP